MSSYTQKATSGSALAFSGLIIAALLAYLLKIALVRFLPVESVGLFYSSLNFIILITLFQKIGLETSLIRFINKWRVNEENNKIASAIIYVVLFQLLIGIIYTIVVLLFSEYIGIHYFKHPLAPAVLRLLSLLIILLIFEDIPRRIFQSFNKMFWFSFIEAFKSILFLMLVIIGFFFETSVLVPVYGFLAATIIISIFGVAISLKTFNIFKYRIEAGWSIFKRLFIFGLPLILLVIGHKIIESIDLLILTYFRNLYEVGIYSMVLPTAALCLFFFRAVSVVILPLSSELWARNENDKLIDAIVKLNRYLFIAISPIILILFVYAELALTLLFGTAYGIGSTALRIILPGVAFFGLAHLNINILIAIGDAKHAGMSMILGALINILLNILFIPSFGMVGAAGATLISYLSVYTVSKICLRKALRFKQLSSSFVKIIIAAAAFTLVATILKNLLAIKFVFLEVAIVLLISSLIYTFLIYKMKLFTIGELKNIIKLSIGVKK